jgi:hypothetical protein
MSGIPRPSALLPDRRRASLDRRPKWHRSVPALTAVVSTYLAATLLLGLVVEAGVVASLGRNWGLPLDARCRADATSCEILSGFAVPLLTIALGFAVFVAFRLTRVHRRYKRRVLADPRKLVPTAGSIIQEVVGRDELCYVVMQNLRDRSTRRPHVIVGGVGAGKTAVLVQMTKLLAECGAIPVPVMLREAQDAQTLDFRQLAHDRFCTEIAGTSLYAGEDERAWRRLCRDEKVVVLADGLEEALIDNNDRNSLIRFAIERAGEQQIPLVIASRPHDPLRNMKAAIIELEPLNEEAALQFVKKGAPARDADRLDWIVETADVAEEPLYLQITRQLHQQGLLDHVTPAPGREPLEIRGADRTQLRLHLLDTWLAALIEGHFRGDQSINVDDRRTAVECVSALACVGLKKDSVDVKFADLMGEEARVASRPRTGRAGRRLHDAEPKANIHDQSGPRVILPQMKRHEPHPGINREMIHRLCGHSPDVGVAASWAEQLGLVEVHGDGVRFQHSILQAYLGSRYMSAALQDSAYCFQVGQKPGREFLIAVVMHFRSKSVGDGASRGSQGAADAPAPTPVGVADVLKFLTAAANIQEVPAKELDIYAAQLEIDSATGGGQHREIAQSLCKDWDQILSRGDKILQEAKLGLVHRFGDAVLKVPDPAYENLYYIGTHEEYYPVRLAVSQEIAVGRKKAYEILAREFAATLDSMENRRRDVHSPDAKEPRQEWREQVMAAWLAPQLAWSGEHEYLEPDKHNLGRWFTHLGIQAIESDHTPLPISLEIGLAQGFKYAANRRYRRSGNQADPREWLADRAMEMLKRSRFWFSHLTLLHALCLWELPDGRDGNRAPTRSSADIEAVVTQWLDVAGSEQGGREKVGPKRTHPFVVEASELVVRTLETRDPQKYIWIDESGVIGKVGSHGEGSVETRKHHLWIPPSTGWSVLDRRAQQLVADILLLLNLAERGESPADHDRRLGYVDRIDLPPCLAGDRSFLDPGRQLGAAGNATPGSHCKGGCPFKLCPYPTRGSSSYRVDLSEPFCRQQQALLSRHLTPTAGWRWATAASWQRTSIEELREFWTKMADRARTTPPND